jgi:hypothetical protein
MNTQSVQSEQASVVGMNAKAVTALVVGILSLVFFWGGWLFVAGAAGAVGAGVAGSRAAREGRGQLGIATAGLVLGSIALVLQFICLASIGRP